jgi:hypothetical protein
MDPVAKIDLDASLHSELVSDNIETTVASTIVETLSEATSYTITATSTTITSTPTTTEESPPPPSLTLNGMATSTTVTTTTTREFLETLSDTLSATATPTPPVPRDTVRWLISQQTFSGAWIFSEQDVLQLTNNKPLDSFTLPQVGQGKEVLDTALAIAVLESRHTVQQNLWYAIVEKARKRLQTVGLSVEQVNKLIDAIKNQL